MKFQEIQHGIQCAGLQQEASSFIYWQFGLKLSLLYCKCYQVKETADGGHEFCSSQTQDVFLM